MYYLLTKYVDFHLLNIFVLLVVYTTQLRNRMDTHNKTSNPILQVVYNL